MDVSKYNLSFMVPFKNLTVKFILDYVDECIPNKNYFLRMADSNFLINPTTDEIDRKTDDIRLGKKLEATIDGIYYKMDIKTLPEEYGFMQGGAKEILLKICKDIKTKFEEKIKEIIAEALVKNNNSKEIINAKSHKFDFKIDQKYYNLKVLKISECTAKRAPINYFSYDKKVFLRKSNGYYMIGEKGSEKDITKIKYTLSNEVINFQDKTLISIYYNGKKYLCKIKHDRTSEKEPAKESLKYEGINGSEIINFLSDYLLFN